MLEGWTEVDVSAWPVEVQEPRGKRPKFWVRSPDNVLWLRKQPRTRSPAEPAIEALMLRLARAAALPAPESAACSWLTTPPTTSQRGILVRIFLEHQEELSIGSVELRAIDRAYDPENKGMHALARIQRVLAALESQWRRPMLEPFAHMLAFDAWIGNVDRHQENWGVLRSAGVPTRLAPLFDVASCLGAELDLGHRILRPGADLDRYVEKCASGFGDDKRRWPLLSMRSVVETVSTWPEWRAGIETWLADFASAMDTFGEVAGRFPADWLPAERAAFACNLLRTRLEWLRRCCE
jgi:hypothetical protein